MWLEHDDIKRLVHELWDSLHFTGNPGFVFCNKLKGLMDYLSIWNIETFGKVSKTMGNLLIDIKNLDAIEEQGVATEEDRILMINKKRDYIRWANLEDKRMKRKMKDH